MILLLKKLVTITTREKSLVLFDSIGTDQWRSQNGIIFTHTQEKSWKFSLVSLLKQGLLWNEKLPIFWKQ